MKNKRTVKVNIPGKLMLLGEHVVLYGHPCIASTVDLFLTVEIGEGVKRDEIELSKDTNDRFVRSALSTLRRKIEVPPLHIKTTSSISGYGLGSSSAVALGMIRGAASLFDLKFSQQELFDIVLDSVLKIQGKASGFDIAVQLYGYTIEFEGKTKSFEVISREKLPIAVVFTGKKADTKTLIENVSKQYSENGGGVQALFTDIEKIVHEGREAIQKKDWKKLGECFNANQSLLRQLGVSTPEIDKIVTSLIDSGCYGAKLSGAGGGDCVIAVVPEDFKTHLNVLSLTVGSTEGVRIDDK